MPGLLQEPQFEHVKIKEIGPTFAAEVEGVDFSQDIPQEVFDEILKAITKAGFPLQYKPPLSSDDLAVWRTCIPSHRSRRHSTRRVLKTFWRT
jgi:hypothetical protein